MASPPPPPLESLRWSYSSNSGSLLSNDVWPRAQRALPRFKVLTFFALVFVPATLTVVFLVVLIHDLFAEQQTQHCWERTGEDGRVAMAWAGSFVHWLSRDWRGETYECNFVLQPQALIVVFLVLPPTWVLIIASSWQTRRLRRDKGVVRSLLTRVYEALDEDAASFQLTGYLGQVQRNEQTVALLQALERDGRSTKYDHINRATLFQVVMFAFDLVVKGYTLRWILWYQVLWFSFITTIVQVRPLVKFCVFLSRTLLDLYIELLRARQGSWLQLLEWHRELEMDVLRLWSKVNLHAVLPSVPFFSLALLHFLVDGDEISGTIVASFLLVTGGLVLVSILQPMARITSMFTGSLVFKAEPKLVKGQAPEIRRPGGMAIVAVARSMAFEEPPRSPAEDQQYAIFLEYVQGSRTGLALGWPGIFMVPITSSVVAGIFTTFILKLPLFVSLFLGARHHVNRGK